MAIVNISLVGGQSMPVYRGFEEPQKPDKIILIYSDMTYEEAKSIGDKSGLPFELKQFDAFNYSSILKSGEILLDNLEGNKVIINITSGTKPWAVAFSLLAINRENCTIIYFDQNSIMHDLTHQYLDNSLHDLDIATIFRYNNQSVPDHTLFTDYTQEDENVLNSVIKLRSKNYTDFNYLTSFENRNWKRDFDNSTILHPQQTLPSGSMILYDKPQNKVFIKLKNRYLGYTEKTLHSPHVEKIVFNTGWFEYEVALLMSQWQHCKEIWMNVAIPYSNNNTKNEIDVMVNTGKKLIFVECKTQIKDTTDIDKFRSAVRNFGGWSSKAIFITRASMTNYAREKCEDNGIIFFSLEDVVPQRQALNLTTSDIKARRQTALFRLLENEILNSNT